MLFKLLRILQINFRLFNRLCNFKILTSLILQLEKFNYCFRICKKEHQYFRLSLTLAQDYFLNMILNNYIFRIIIISINNNKTFHYKLCRSIVLIQDIVISIEIKCSYKNLNDILIY